jgi:D-psicose/D-tagatose/L-ribulose 3-epimerase
MFKYSATQWIFGNEEMEVSLRRLKKFGYDGVELAGEPETMNVDAINLQLEEYELECTSICGIYTTERDLSSSRPETRSKAIKYVKDCVDMAVQVGAPLVIVVPTPVGKTAPETTSQEEWQNSVESLREAGNYAQTKDIYLTIEALNRFESYMVNKLDTAKKLVEEVNVGSVQIMADLFHMNIEERNHETTLRNIASYLKHVHIADNTRESAGLGMTNFRDIICTLLDIGYKGAITMEFLPPVSNPYLVAQQNEGNEIYDQYTQQSITHIKGIVDRIGEENNNKQ